MGSYDEILDMNYWELNAHLHIEDIKPTSDWRWCCINSYQVSDNGPISDERTQQAHSLKKFAGIHVVYVWRHCTRDSLCIERP